MTKHLSIQDNWIELFPYGVTFGVEDDRPVLLLKDESGERVLPVWLSPLDAGMVLAESDTTSAHQQAHKLSLEILKSFSLELKQCRFIELQGHYQIVQLALEGPDFCRQIISRADEAMSFCLNAKARFFAQDGLINRSRQLTKELTPAVDRAMNSMDKNQSYLM